MARGFTTDVCYACGHPATDGDGPYGHGIPSMNKPDCHVCPVCQAEQEKRTNCEYGCPYGSEEHEWRLLEWERTGRW